MKRGTLLGGLSQYISWFYLLKTSSCYWETWDHRIVMNITIIEIFISFLKSVSPSGVERVIGFSHPKNLQSNSTSRDTGSLYITWPQRSPRGTCVWMGEGGGKKRELVPPTIGGWCHKPCKGPFFTFVKRSCRARKKWMCQYKKKKDILIVFGSFWRSV